MRRSAVGRGAVLGGLTSLPILALLYLGEQLAGFPFVPFDLFDWLARVLPGGVVTAGIDALVRLITALNLGATSVAAKRIEQASALLLFVACGAALGVTIVLLLRRRTWSTWQAGAIGGIVTFFLISALELGSGGWHPAAPARRAYCALNSSVCCRARAAWRATSDHVPAPATTAAPWPTGCIGHDTHRQHRPAY